MSGDETYRCVCSWIGGDPDTSPKGRNTCPACWKHDRKRVTVFNVDPNICLRNVRDSVGTINEDDGEDDDSEAYLGIVAMAETAQSAATYFAILDDWIMAGGALPDAWKKKTPSAEKAAKAWLKTTGTRADAAMVASLASLLEEWRKR